MDAAIFILTVAWYVLSVLGGLALVGIGLKERLRTRLRPDRSRRMPTPHRS